MLPALNLLAYLHLTPRASSACKGTQSQQLLGFYGAKAMRSLTWRKPGLLPGVSEWTRSNLGNNANLSSLHTDFLGIFLYFVTSSRAGTFCTGTLPVYICHLFIASSPSIPDFCLWQRAKNLQESQGETKSNRSCCFPAPLWNQRS